MRAKVALWLLWLAFFVSVRLCCCGGQVGGERWGNGARESKNGENGDVEERKETGEGRGGAVLGCFGGFLRLVRLPDGVESLGAFNGRVNSV